MTEIKFQPVHKGAAIPMPENPGPVVTKLRYRGADGVKMMAVVAGVPTPEQVAAARLLAIRSGADDVEWSILHATWEPVQVGGPDYQPGVTLAGLLRQGLRVTDSFLLDL